MKDGFETARRFAGVLLFKVISYMKAKVINPHAIRYGEIVEVETVWTDSYITTDGDEIHYGKDELEFVDPND